MISVRQCPGAYDRGVIQPSGVNIGNWRLIEAKMKGCQVRDSIVRETRYVIFTNFMHDIYEWRLINV